MDKSILTQEKKIVYIKIKLINESIGFYVYIKFKNIKKTWHSPLGNGCIYSEKVDWIVRFKNNIQKYLIKMRL